MTTDPTTALLDWQHDRLAQLLDALPSVPVIEQRPLPATRRAGQGRGAGQDRGEQMGRTVRIHDAQCAAGHGIHPPALAVA